MDTPTATEPETPVATVHARNAHRWQRIARNIVLGVIATLFAVWLVLFITKGRFLRHAFETVASSLSHRQVRVGGDFQLYFAPFRLKFVADGFSISNPDWAKTRPLFLARHLDARIAPLSLIFGQRHIYSLVLDGGRGDFEWDAKHLRNTWTFASGGKGKPFAMPNIDTASITDTHVHYGDPAMPMVADLTIAPIAAHDTHIDHSVGITGSGTFRTTPFRLSARLLSPNATLASTSNRLEARAWAANSVIDVSGTLPGLTDIEGVTLDVAADGGDLSELLKVIDVAIPQTRHYKLKARLVKRSDTYRFTGVTGTFGQSDLAGHFSITNAKRLKLDAALVTKRLDIIDAAPFIGYNPDLVASKGAVAAATGAGTRRILPNASLPVAMLQRFDASLDWKIGIVRSRNVPVSNISLTLSLDRGRLALSPLTFSMARGDVSSDLIFDTRKRPSAIQYDIRLASTPMGRLLAGYGVADSGTTGTIHGRIELEGRGDTIHDSLASASGRIAFVMPHGTLWTQNAQLAELDLGTFVSKMFQGKLKKPIEVNCGLIAFTVRKGKAAADPILIDTSKNVVTARGGFSFDSEAIDMAFRADGKKFSLFSGQSPVGLGGHFAQPQLQVITPQLLGRAGAGIGLAVVATPIAGLLAFVDPGDAKSAACGPVLAGARANAQRTSKGKPRDDVGHGQAKVAG